MTTLTSTGVQPSDRLRQVAVTVAEVCCVVGTLVGVGVIGTRVAESSGGALAADATLIAPAGPAFAIWTPIYLGLAGFTVYQWLPAQTREPRHRAIGWLAAQPAVTSVIAGVTRPEQLAQNVAAGSWDPGPEQLAAIRAIATA